MATRPDPDDDWDDLWEEDDDAPDFAPSVRREAEPEADLDPDEVIAECRDRFTDAPRYFGSELKAKLKWPFPVWIWFDGDFRPYRLARKELLRDGVVVWGALIQANQVLFDPRETAGAPGEMLFCPDPRRQKERSRATGNCGSSRTTSRRRPPAPSAGRSPANCPTGCPA